MWFYQNFPKTSQELDSCNSGKAFSKILLWKLSELPECKSDLGTVWSSWLTVEFQKSNPLKYYKKSQSFREKKFMKNYYI